MLTMEERSAARRKVMTLEKIDLHAKEHHSFHLHLDLKNSWELLARLSKESWIESTGELPPEDVDKSVVKHIRLDQR